ncbi:MAG: TIGR02281 family clan AA aspartic protease [Rhodobacteraceae bacterium]|jgi:aspartyl protease family protein|nr:TIGR02281 family clan AA aspartic protease [Paracoccaceae bacterium]
MDGDSFGRMAYLVLLLLAVGGWAMVEFRGRLGQAARVLAAWGLIFVGVAAGYGLWRDMQRSMMPVQSVADGGTVLLPQASDGHFYAVVRVNGTDIRFMTDTGATNMVLSREDARRVGLDPDGMVYTGTASTANGIVRTARVTLDEVQLGPFTDEGFPAYVNDGQMDGSLLGMDYLRRYRIQIEGNAMVLSR